MKNRARAIHAWFGEFAQKLNDFPGFAGREQRGGERWYGDMSTFDKVKQRLQGCRPFAWYLRRFKTVYEDVPRRFSSRACGILRPVASSR